MGHDKSYEALTTTLDSLVAYANRRYHIVREDESTSEEDRLLRSHLVQRFCWQHTELMEDFVRDNPDGLDERQLDVARDLMGVLYGSLYLEAQDADTLTLLHDTGSYKALLPYVEQLPDCDEALELRCALVPFGGRIVALPPFIVLGTAPQSFIQDLHDRLAAKSCAHMTSDGQVLFERARAWRKTRAAEDAKRERNRLPCAPGFHRGALTGLDGEQRQTRRQEHADGMALSDGSYLRSLDLRFLETNDLPVTLEEALVLLDDEWLADIAHSTASDNPVPDLPHEELAHWLSERLASCKEDFEITLLWCRQEQFDLIRRLRYTNPISLDGMAPSDLSELYPLVPYLFFICEKGLHHAWMPPEALSLLAQIDTEAIARARERLRLATASAAGIATMCGIISLKDAYERYCHMVHEPLEWEQFEMALEEFSTCASRDDYTLWNHMGTEYVISVEISDESAPARVARESYAKHIVNPSSAGTREDATVVALTAEEGCDFVQRISQKEDELQLLRLSLLNAKDATDPHEILPTMLTLTPIQALLELKALRDLRSFVDRHIPDDEDDYEFADMFARAVAVSVVLMNESYNDTMDLIRLFSMEGCEGTPFPDTLGRLVTNACNALPRWQHNGWSLEEMTEHLTGRRRFFDKDGKERIVATDEPCPCGSGKPYGECCGHIVQPVLERKAG